MIPIIESMASQLLATASSHLAYSISNAFFEEKSYSSFLKYNPLKKKPTIKNKQRNKQENPIKPQNQKNGSPYKIAYSEEMGTPGSKQ